MPTAVYEYANSTVQILLDLFFVYVYVHIPNFYDYLYIIINECTVDVDASEAVDDRDAALEHGERHQQVGQHRKAEEHLQFCGRIW